MSDGPGYVLMRRVESSDLADADKRRLLWLIDFYIRPIPDEQMVDAGLNAVLEEWEQMGIEESVARTFVEVILDEALGALGGLGGGGLASLRNRRTGGAVMARGNSEPDPYALVRGSRPNEKIVQTFADPETMMRAWQPGLAIRRVVNGRPRMMEREEAEMCYALAERLGIG